MLRALCIALMVVAGLGGTGCAGARLKMVTNHPRGGELVYTNRDSAIAKIRSVCGDSYDITEDGITRKYENIWTRPLFSEGDNYMRFVCTSDD